MSYSEEELKIVVAERTTGGPPNPRRCTEVVSRGRRMRRRARVRAAITATGATAAAAIIATVAVSWHETQPRAVPVAVRLPSEVPMPGSAKGLINDDTLPLVKSVQKERMGEKVTLTFTALSVNTMANVRCAVPDAWLVTRWNKPGEPVSVGRCESGDHLSQWDGQSAGGSWVGGTQTLEVWVLPAQAEIDPNSFAYADIQSIAARAGARDGAWAVGIYDRRR